MVVVIHTGAFVGWGEIGAAATSVGKYGVDIFFVISGFTIAKTFSDAQSYRPYLVRRLMRILPLYYLLITMAVLIIAAGVIRPSSWMDDLNATPDLYNWLLHLSMFSFLDYRVTNSLLGVEWTISVEIFWYLVLPPFLFLARTVKGTFSVSLGLLVATALLTYLSKKLLGTSLPVKWTPIAHGHLFFLGAWAYFFRMRSKDQIVKYESLFILSALILFVLSFAVTFSGRGEALAIATVILLAMLKTEQRPILCGALSVKPMLFLGSISYSIYLVHPLVIAGLEQSDLAEGLTGGMWFLLVYLTVVVISFFSYMTIERPTNNLGRTLAGKWSAKE
ncbi:MAG: hypothetical protein BM559_10285 [Roseobacter sp. MedPE-SWchi]|nr:MAG: hypothetical protein BM559_10285 [Roseobacter sp. MedPE-SWchi]